MLSCSIVGAFLLAIGGPTLQAYTGRATASLVSQMVQDGEKESHPLTGAKNEKKPRDKAGALDCKKELAHS